MLLADRLTIPDDARAILFDMDGVLLDTLSLDYEIVDHVLRNHVLRNHVLPNHDPIGVASPGVSNQFIRANFGYDPVEFWRLILIEVGCSADATALQNLVGVYDDQRRAARPKVHDGIREIFAATRREGLAIAVVSNNPQADVEVILRNAGLHVDVDEVVGNDLPGLQKKPAPDAYLEAVSRFGVSPSQCAVVEDSLLGAEAGSRAGCYVVGVATGASTIDELKQSAFVSCCYESFSL